MYLSSASSRLLLYDVNKWELKKSYGCYDGLMRDISWSDDSKYILQVNSKGLVEILTAAEHDVRSLQHIPLKDTWSASFHRDGHRNIGIGTKSGSVMIWDAKNKSVTKTFPTPTHQSSVNHISFNAKNTNLAANMQNGDTIIYGLVSNIPVLTVRLACSRSISAMKFHHESRSLLGLATDEGHVVLRDITTNKDKAFFENVHAAPVSDFAFSLINKDVMLSSGYDSVMHIYDVRLQSIVSTVKTSHTLTALAMNLENVVALGTKGGYVLVYDLRDLKAPTKILKGHNEEVSKVAFQLLRKKTFSTEVSLKEDIEMHLSPQKQSPVQNRLSDNMFLANTSPRINIEVSDTGGDKTDSFFTIMGLDKTFEDINKSSEVEQNNERSSTNRQLNKEKNISVTSTPIEGRIAENLVFPSPICVPNGIEDRKLSVIMKQSNPVTATAVDSKTMDELKDFIKLTISDVADDNRNYFLHIMMALTKQKLFLEKQLAGMDSQMQALIQNQNALIETNRKLVIEMEQLKTRQNSIL